MNKSALILDTPSCCELCRFIDYEPKCRCRMLTYRHAEIKDRFLRLENCPLRELPEKHNTDGMQVGEEWAVFNRGWNACLEAVTGGKGKRH